MTWQEDADLERIVASLDRLQTDLAKGQRMQGAKDIAVRAAKTFVQVFVTAFPVSGLVSVDIPALKIAALSAGAAAASVLWNAALLWAQK
jgi:ABC-type iron transport system FetAB permease component